MGRIIALCLLIPMGMMAQNTELETLEAWVACPPANSVVSQHI